MQTRQPRHTYAIVVGPSHYGQYSILRCSHNARRQFKPIWPDITATSAAAHRQAAQVFQRQIPVARHLLA
jgi:hypothetical protein